MESQDTKPKTTNIYKIDIKKYEVVKIIKEGDFECVYSIKDKETHNGFSATTIYCSREKDDYKQIITREINILLQIHHPTLINFIGYSLKDFEGKKNITILMEHFKNISLSYIIKKVRTRPDEIDFDNTDRQITLIGIARGMMFLHQNHILHRDLNPSNIFLDEECEPHIIGHGLSKIYLNDQNKKTINQRAPTIYMAPETIKDNIYNTKTDVYSFGILMYELITNQIPYPELQNDELTEAQIRSAIIEKEIQPTFSFEVKKSIKELIQRCWSKNSAERPTFEEIFYKLSFNEWDVDVEEKSATENEYKISYFLDNVYQKKVFRYVDKIKTTSNLDELVAQNSHLMSQIYSQKEEIESMKNEIEKLKKNQAEQKPIAATNSNENDDEIESMKNEIEQLKKSQAEQNSITNNSDEKDEEIEKMKKEIELLKKSQAEQKNTEKDEEMKNMKKEIKQLKKLLLAKQKSQENEANNNNNSNSNTSINNDNDDDEIQKLKKELSDQQKITNALIQHVKKIKSSCKEISSKYDDITSEHTNHIQILAKEIKALKTTTHQVKHQEVEAVIEEEEENSNKNDNSQKIEIDLEGGLIEPFGIQNIENACYVNSSLQCFLSLPLFIESIDSNLNTKPILLLSQFKSFIKSHDPSKIRQIVTHKNKDSFEFTISFIKMIQDEIKNDANSNDLFNGKCQMISKCSKCMNESFEEQDFTSFNLSIKNSRPILYLPFSFKDNPIELIEKPKPNSKIQIMNSKAPILIGQFILMAKDGNKFKLVENYSTEYSAIYAFELNNYKKSGPLTVVQLKDEEGIPLTTPFLCEIPNITFVNENELKTIIINRIKDVLPNLNRSKLEELKKFIKFTKPNKFPNRFKTLIKAPMFCTSHVNVRILKKDEFNFAFKSVKIQKKEMNLLNLFNSNIQQSKKDYSSKSMCEKCNNNTRCFKRIKYTKLPKILIFKLNRFNVDADDDDDDSISDETEISFPHSIAIDLDDKFNKIKIDPDQNDHAMKYELKAISHHSGSFSSGHFWTDGKRADKWYELNDTKVDSISEPNGPTQSSYIAFYQCLS